MLLFFLKTVFIATRSHNDCATLAMHDLIERAGAGSRAAGAVLRQLSARLRRWRSEAGAPHRPDRPTDRRPAFAFVATESAVVGFDRARCCCLCLLSHWSDWRSSSHVEQLPATTISESVQQRRLHQSTMQRVRQHSPVTHEQSTMP